MHDEDNDGRFPDESPVEVRFPRSKQEEQGYVPPESGERPMVVECDHPSWAEVNAEQQERIHGPTTD